MGEKLNCVLIYIWCPCILIGFISSKHSGSESSDESEEEPGRQKSGRSRSRTTRCCGLFRCLLGLLQLLTGLLACATSCLANCCCRPCCSAAGLLGGVGAIGGLVAGGAALGVIGLIPIPVEFTRNICQLERQRLLNESTSFTGMDR